MHMGHVLLLSKGRHISGKTALSDTGPSCCPDAPAAAAAPVGTGDGPRDGLALPAPCGLTVVVGWLS